MLVLDFEMTLFLVLRLELSVFLDLIASASSVGTRNGLDFSSTKIFLGLINGLKVDLIFDSSTDVSESIKDGRPASSSRSINFGF